MTYKVRLWVENGIVKCCSGVCTEQSCPRVAICKETEIAEIVRCKDCTHYTNPEIGWCDIHSHLTSSLDDWTSFDDWTTFDDDSFCSDGERRDEE